MGDGRWAVGNEQWAMDSTQLLEGLRVALRMHIPVHLIGQKTCFWRPTLGVFKVHNAPQCLGGSGVALRMHIPVHLTGQKTCFWRPTMLVFNMHKATQSLGGSGVAL